MALLRSKRMDIMNEKLSRDAIPYMVLARAGGLAEDDRYLRGWGSHKNYEGDVGYARFLRDMHVSVAKAMMLDTEEEALAWLDAINTTWPLAGAKFFRLLICLHGFDDRRKARNRPVKVGPEAPPYAYQWAVIDRLCDLGADANLGPESLLAYDLTVAHPYRQVREIIFRRGLHRNVPLCELPLPRRGGGDEDGGMGEQDWRVRTGGVLHHLCHLLHHAHHPHVLGAHAWGLNLPLMEIIHRDYTAEEEGKAYCAVQSNPRPRILQPLESRVANPDVIGERAAREDYGAILLEYARAGAVWESGAHLATLCAVTSLKQRSWDEEEYYQRKRLLVKELLEMGKADANMMCTMQTRYVKRQRLLDTIPPDYCFLDLAALLVSHGATSDSRWAGYVRRCGALLALSRPECKLPESLVRSIAGALGIWSDAKDGVYPLQHSSNIYEVMSQQPPRTYGEGSHTSDLAARASDWSLMLMLVRAS